MMTQEDFDIKTKYITMSRNFDPLRTAWHMLYDTESKRPLACSTLQGTITGLASRYPNSTPWYFVNSTANIHGSLKIDSAFKTARAWEWKFDLESRRFDHDTDQLSLEEIYRFRLASERAAVLDRLTSGVNSFRRPFVKDTLDQNYIYDIKKAEAEQILLTTEDIDANTFPFVSDYASTIGCDIKVAAMEIIKNSEFQKEIYRQSELFRLKYSNAIYSATDIVDLKAIMSDINKELLVYIKI